MKSINIENVVDAIVKTGWRFKRTGQTRFDVKEKEDGIISTSYDALVEVELMHVLQRINEDAKFLSEESYGKGSKQFPTVNTVMTDGDVFVIDPIDGTLNFFNKLPLFTISVAMFRNGRPMLGVIYDVSNDTAYYAEYNSGIAKMSKIISLVNGEDIYATTTEVRRTVAINEHPLYLCQKMTGPSTPIKGIYELSNTRVLGCSSLSMCYVATNVAEFFYEENLKIWNYAAGFIILNEARAIVSDINGNEIDFSKLESSFYCSRRLKIKDGIIEE